MRNIIFIITFALCLTMLISPALAAQTQPPPRPPVTIPNLSPWVGSSGEPGAIAWRHAAHFSVDNETDPGRNTPAPVATEVYVGYTKTALWLRYVANDPDPDAIRARYRRHDGITGNGDDYVGIIFSPFNDSQSGYEFFCGAGDTEVDAFRQQGNEYSSYDAIWYCDATLTKNGYTAVMQIPFRSLKFPQSDRPQTWRVVFYRNWPRSVRHQILQIHENFNSDCLLCQAEVVRTETPIRSPGANLLIIPSVTASRTDIRKTPASGLEKGSPGLSGSLDVRWAIRPDLEWSTTLNPNFSQVAPDVIESTVNRRFAIFFPENRPFFRQGTWVFNTPGFDFNQFDDDTRFVDTRQIADPHWASKVVGQVGNHVIGALVADDGITNILLPGPVQSSLQSFNFPTRDALLRYRYDFVGNSSLGFLATGRRGSGYNNGVIAADAYWQLDPSNAVTIQTAHSTTTYPDDVATAFGIEPGTITGNGWILSYNRTRNNYIASISVGQIDAGFRADLGFLPQVGYRETSSRFEYNWYSNDSWWNNGGFGASYDWMQATGGGPILDREAQLYTFVHTVEQGHIVFFIRHEDQFFAGKTFSLDQYELVTSAQPYSWLRLELDATGGDGIDFVGAREGALLSISPSFTLSPGRHLKIDFVGNFQRLNVAGGRLFTANLYDLRISWYFNARMFVRAIAQEQNIRRNVALFPPGTESRTRTLATQWLFGYELNPWTSLFAGFANGYLGTGDVGLVQQNRTYFLKLSYAFQT